MSPGSGPDPLDPPGPELRARLQQLLDSYRRWTGESLCGLGVDELSASNMAVLAHGIQQPPVLWYGNARALRLWRMSFEDFAQMPSLKTAEADVREVREALLEEVRGSGVSRDYRGVRVASDGSRFRIEGATVWNILDDEERVVGQAACFENATPL